MYISAYQYTPEIQEVTVFSSDTQNAEAARVLVSVVGVSRGDDESGIPPAVEIRLRFENHSAGAIAVNPAECRLFAADLREFPPPSAEPDGTIELEPGESVVITVRFPFPGGEIPGRFDLDGLNVRWSIQIDGVDRAQSATFNRLREMHYNSYERPFPSSRISVGGGYTRQ